jgi:hypothetical protein
VSGGKTYQARFVNAAQTTFQEGLCVAVYISQHFKHWHFYYHFYVAVFKAIFVKVLISVVAVLT